MRLTCSYNSQYIIPFAPYFCHCHPVVSSECYRGLVGCAFSSAWLCKCAVDLPRYSEICGNNPEMHAGAIYASWSLIQFMAHFICHALVLGFPINQKILLCSQILSKHWYVLWKKQDTYHRHWSSMEWKKKWLSIVTSLMDLYLIPSNYWHISEILE